MSKNLVKSDGLELKMTQQNYGLTRVTVYCKIVIGSTNNNKQSLDDESKHNCNPCWNKL